MRGFLLPVLVLGALAFAPVARAGSVISTVDFEGVTLPASGFNNNSGGFSIDGNFFNNSYENYPEWNMEFWSGWAVSNHVDNTTEGFGNQYSAITGGGFDGSSQYAVAFDGGTFGGAFLNLADGQSAHSMEVTNTAYSYFTMLNGYNVARPFGDDDFFLLTINGYSGLGGAGDLIGSIPVYLAGGGEILNTWSHVDLTAVGSARSLTFTFSSSDNDPIFGMLTPAYVAVDNFQTIGAAAAVPEPAGLVLLGVGLIGAVGLARRARGG